MVVVSIFHLVLQFSNWDITVQYSIVQNIGMLSIKKHAFEHGLSTFYQF